VSYVAIMNVVGNRVTKYAEFDTEGQAFAHIEEHQAGWPDAFAVEKPAGSFLSWYFEGQQISIVPQPEVIPDRVTARQFKMQLEKDGLLGSVEAWVGQQAKLVQIAFNNSSTFVRDEPMMQAGFAALGFQSPQIDAFFKAAFAL
jgi:hypothetical protein